MALGRSAQPVIRQFIDDTQYVTLSRQTFKILQWRKELPSTSESIDWIFSSIFYPTFALDLG